MQLKYPPTGLAALGMLIVASLAGAQAPAPQQEAPQTKGREAGMKPAAPDVVIGDAVAGQAYFAKTCSQCHNALATGRAGVIGLTITSVGGDLTGIATRITNPRTLQERWLAGGGGDMPAPQAAHKTLLPTYTDQIIHNVTAYLMTLK